MSLSPNAVVTFGQGLHQFVERLAEFPDSFKLPRHIVDADSQLRQSLQHPAGFPGILFEPGYRLSVVAVGVEGLAGSLGFISPNLPLHLEPAPNLVAFSAALPLISFIDVLGDLPPHIDRSLGQ
jgi:hypothetical protein